MSKPEQDLTSEEVGKMIEENLAYAEKRYLEWLESGKRYCQDTFETLSQVEEKWRGFVLAEARRRIQKALKDNG